MPCFSPIKGYFVPNVGFRENTYRCSDAKPGVIPCGKCDGCYMDRVGHWTTRLGGELQTSGGDGLFLTGTFADDALPADGGLCRSHPHDFMKSLRNRLSYDAKKSGVLAPVLRYMMVGEYGGLTLRPHYHWIIIGWWPSDAEPARRSQAGELLHVSETISKCWPHGEINFGRVSSQSIGYVARGHVGKINPKAEALGYCLPHPLTGEFHDVERPFSSVSNRPGIGSEHFEQFSDDYFPSDFLIREGHRVAVPRYYAEKLKRRFNGKGAFDGEAVQSKTVAELRAPVRVVDDFAPVREAREARALDPRQKANNTPERLAVRAECLRLRLDRLKRDL